MQTCSECIHWIERVPANPYAPGGGQGWRECALTRTGDARDDEQDLESRAVAVDGSGYFAALITAPDFGCIQWGVKPDGDNAE